MQVNYVREHERFIEYAADERIPANVQLLWYALMHIFNQRAEGNEWPDGFIRITNDRLFTYLPIKWDAMAKARNALKQMGRIDFRNGNRNKAAPEYRIIPFYPSCYPFRTDNTGGNEGGNRGGNEWGNRGGNTGDININVNETYTNPIRETDEDDDDDDVIRAGAGEEEDPITDRAERRDGIRGAFRRAFGRSPYPGEVERLVVMSWRMGFTVSMVSLALEKAAGAGAGSPVDYCAEILDEWRREEVRTPEQADEHYVEHLEENRKGGLYGSGDPVEDHRRRQEARERRRQENLQAGLVRYG